MAAQRARMTVCTTPGCPDLVPGGGRCDDCQRQADRRRGSSSARGYGHAHRTRFRAGVLKRHPRCVCTDTSHGHPAPCGAPSEHADHWPIDRRTLQLRGLDPDDPVHGRGLCHGCHSSETAAHQPGGWNTQP